MRCVTSSNKKIRKKKKNQNKKTWWMAKVVGTVIILYYYYVYIYWVIGIPLHVISHVSITELLCVYNTRGQPRALVYIAFYITVEDSKIIMICTKKKSQAPRHLCILNAVKCLSIITLLCARHRNLEVRVMSAGYR